MPQPRCSRSEKARSGQASGQGLASQTKPPEAPYSSWSFFAYNPYSGKVSACPYQNRMENLTTVIQERYRAYLVLGFNRCWGRYGIFGVSVGGGLRYEARQSSAPCRPGGVGTVLGERDSLPKKNSDRSARLVAWTPQQVACSIKRFVLCTTRHTNTNRIRLFETWQCNHNQYCATLIVRLACQATR